MTMTPNPFELSEDFTQQKATKELKKAIQRAGKDVGSIMRKYDNLGASAVKAQEIILRELKKEMKNWL